MSTIQKNIFVVTGEEFVNLHYTCSVAAAAAAAAAVSLHFLQEFANKLIILVILSNFIKPGRNTNSALVISNIIRKNRKHKFVNLPGTPMCDGAIMEKPWT